MLDRTTGIAVAGAGSIGCYAGGCLALSGRAVTLLARPRIIDAARQIGWRSPTSTAASAGRPVRLSRLLPIRLQAFAGAGLVLVTVKSGDTAEMAKLVASHAPADATVVSLQNGTGNAALLRQSLLRHAARGRRHGAVQRRPGRNAGRAAGLSAHDQRRGTCRSRCARSGRSAECRGFSGRSAADMTAVLWGKLRPQPRQCAQRAVRPAACRTARRPALAAGARRADGRGAGGDAPRRHQAGSDRRRCGRRCCRTCCACRISCSACSHGA